MTPTQKSDGQQMSSSLSEPRVRSDSECLSAELVAAVQHGYIHELEKCIRNPSTDRPRISQLRDKDGCTLLHWAAANNRTAIATLLIDDGADVNATGGLLGETPLHWACRSGERWWGHTHMVALLLSSGADINVKSFNGSNALHVSVKCLAVQISLQLLSSGRTDVDSINPLTGDTPLLSLLKNYSDRFYDGRTHSLARLLIAWGANVLAQDSDGNTALHLFSLMKSDDFDSTVAFAVAEAVTHASPSGASSSDCIDIRNRRGQTAAQLAAEACEADPDHDTGKLAANFFEQYWIYQRTPAVLPTVNYAFCVFSLAMLINRFHWFGILYWGPIYMAVVWTDQASIPCQSSRGAFGFSWGVIIAILFGFRVYTAPYLSRAMCALVYMLAAIVMSALYITHVTKPAALLRGHAGDAEVRMLTDRLVAHGHPGKFSSSKKKVPVYWNIYYM